VTVSDEQARWLLENDPEFRKQYETMVLMQAFSGQSTQPLQAAPEAPQRTKDYKPIIVCTAALFLLCGILWAAWTYLDIGIATSKQQNKVVPGVRNPSGTGAQIGDTRNPPIPTALSIAEQHPNDTTCVIGRNDPCVPSDGIEHTKRLPVAKSAPSKSETVVVVPIADQFPDAQSCAVEGGNNPCVPSVQGEQSKVVPDNKPAPASEAVIVIQQEPIPVAQNEGSKAGRSKK
jgi:hypothetical protein